MPTALHRPARCHPMAWVAAAMLGCATVGASAQEALDGEPAFADLDEPAEATASFRANRVDGLSAPRFTRVESPVPSLPPGAATPPALLAEAGARLQLEGVSQRWWLTADKADLGVGVGTIGYSVVAPGGGAEAARALRHAVPNLSVGMRYRVSSESAIYADASNARGLYGKGSDAYFTKLGVEWQGRPRTGWSIARGGIGLQLDSGKTMTMRVKGGGLGVYYRSKF